MKFIIMHILFNRLRYRKLVVVTTLLSEEDKGPLKEMLNFLGGHLVKEWSDSCTHLVSTQLMVTPKVGINSSWLISYKLLVIRTFYSKS